MITRYHVFNPRFHGVTMAVQRLTEAEVREWPVTVDVVTAGKAWGYGRRKSYELARSSKFPCPVRRDGNGCGRLTVAKADAMRALGYEVAAPGATATAA